MLPRPTAEVSGVEAFMAAAFTAAVFTAADLTAAVFSTGAFRRVRRFRPGYYGNGSCYLTVYGTIYCY